MAPVGQIPAYNLAPMGADAIARSLEDFLAESPNAVVVEGGEVIFDFVSAKYACSAERGKCLLHLWSEERNTVRRVLDSEMRNGALRLTVQRFGQARPGVMEICRDRDRRTPTARKAARASYQRLLERLLKRSFPELTPGRMSTAADLERSFGPVYTRGELRARELVLGSPGRERAGAAGSHRRQRNLRTALAGRLTQPVARRGGRTQALPSGRQFGHRA